MKEKRWNIIAKHLTNEQLSNEEAKYVSSEKVAVEESADDLKEIDKFLKLGQFDSDKAWKKIDGKTHRTVRLWNRTLFLRIAACIAVVATLAFSLDLLIERSESNKSIQIVEATQGTVSFILPDSSRVILRDGSTISFPKNFASRSREVKLSGEAFFEVEPNEKVPFIVNTGEALVRVVGTSFNVNTKSYRSRCVEVAVQTGIVELLNAKSEKRKISLEPGTCGIFEIESAELTKSAEFDQNLLAWRTFDLLFDNAPVEQVFAVLSNVYGVAFDISSLNHSNNRRLTARYKQQSLDSILKLMELSHSLSFEKMDNKNYRIIDATKE